MTTLTEHRQQAKIGFSASGHHEEGRDGTSREGHGAGETTTA
jgi:hypothetical protein